MRALLVSKIKSRSTTESCGGLPVAEIFHDASKGESILAIARLRRFLVGYLRSRFEGEGWKMSRVSLFDKGGQW